VWGLLMNPTTLSNQSGVSGRVVRRSDASLPPPLLAGLRRDFSHPIAIEVKSEKISPPRRLRMRSPGETPPTIGHSLPSAISNLAHGIPPFYSAYSRKCRVLSSEIRSI